MCRDVYVVTYNLKAKREHLSMVPFNQGLKHPLTTNPNLNK